MEPKKKSQLADEFRVEFNAIKEKLVKDTAELDQVPVTELKEKISSICLELQNLKVRLQESSKYLPAYTEKCRQDDLKALAEALQERENQLAPKPKFSFKNKLPVPAKKDSGAANPNQQPKTAKVHESGEEGIKPLETRNDPNFLTIQRDTIESGQKADNVFVFEEDKLNKIDVMVQELDDKKICLVGSPSTLHLSKLANCKVLCGPVQTSVFIDNCTNCTFYLCCQQLRTHDSSGLDIYLRVSSRGIIEDCSKIRFAPYVWNHPKSSDLHRLANIKENMERFDAIDDFNWLAFTTQSPNWSVLPENERKDFS